MKKLPQIVLFGRELDFLYSSLIEQGFSIVEKNPDLIITHGGDGTLLAAERHWPGIPKFPIRDAGSAPHCMNHSYKWQIESLKNGELKTQSLIKLQATVRNQCLIAMNDLFIHTQNQVSAVRYRVEINGELYAEEIFGDGVGLATPFGSTAYYRSITNSIFRVGIGLAFSNSTEAISHLVLNENSEIKIKIIRGPAILVADNDSQFFNLKDGDEIFLKKIDKVAQIVGLDVFMCPECRRLRHGRRRAMLKGIARDELLS